MRFRPERSSPPTASTSVTCRVLGVSRPDHYDSRTRPPSQLDLEDAYLANTIVDAHGSRCYYGAPRVRAELRLWIPCGTTDDESVKTLAASTANRHRMKTAGTRDRLQTKRVELERVRLGTRLERQGDDRLHDSSLRRPACTARAKIVDEPGKHGVTRLRQTAFGPRRQWRVRLDFDGS
jgi:hypothetical protein